MFVQISDENVHLVRCICDEIFGRENFVSMIAFRTAMTKPTRGINNVFDYLVIILNIRMLYTDLVTVGAFLSNLCRDSQKQKGYIRPD